MTASDNLRHALVVLGAAGGRPRCADPGDHDLWVSDSAADRELAAARCVRCPVLTVCDAAAKENDEKHHVWAAKDRTVKPTKKKEKK